MNFVPWLIGMMSGVADVDEHLDKCKCCAVNDNLANAVDLVLVWYFISLKKYDMI